MLVSASVKPFAIFTGQDKKMALTRDRNNRSLYIKIKSGLNPAISSPDHELEGVPPVAKLLIPTGK
jgi:hypothetical protein